MNPEYVRFTMNEAEALADFLTAEDWPFHAGGRPDRETALRRIDVPGHDSGEVRGFWIELDRRRIGFVRLDDVCDEPDETPTFDLRVTAAHRGRGIGRHAVDWLTRYLFTELSDIGRIEGTTRQDNVAMRRTFRRCGYAKEAHYRNGWPDRDGRMHDAVGYAILREDWRSGTVTPPEWDDEPS